MDEPLPLADGYYLTFTTSSGMPGKEGKNISSSINRQMEKYPDFEVVDASFTWDGTTLGMSSFLISLRLRKRVIVKENLEPESEGTKPHIIGRH